jgi:hypothetical protein
VRGVAESSPELSLGLPLSLAARAKGGRAAAWSLELRGFLSWLRPGLACVAVWPVAGPVGRPCVPVPGWLHLSVSLPCVACGASWRGGWSCLQVLGWQRLTA